MRYQSSYEPPCSGCGFPFAQPQEVAWAKATFHVDPAFVGTTLAELRIWMGADNVVATVDSKEISAGQDVTLEGKITPVQGDHLLVGLYPPSATIWDIKVEASDAEQAPADGLGGIWTWIMANKVLAGAVAIGVYLVTRGK